MQDYFSSLHKSQLRRVEQSLAWSDTGIKPSFLRFSRNRKLALCKFIRPILMRLSVESSVDGDKVCLQNHPFFDFETALTSQCVPQELKATLDMALCSAFKSPATFIFVRPEPEVSEDSDEPPPVIRQPATSMLLYYRCVVQSCLFKLNVAAPPDVTAIQRCPLCSALLHMVDEEELLSEGTYHGMTIEEHLKAPASWRYMVNEKKFTAQELEKQNFSLRKLLRQGIAVTDLYHIGYSVRDLLDANVRKGIVLADLPVASLKEAGFEPRELRKYDRKFAELVDAGYDMPALKNAGYPFSDFAGIKQVTQAGFTVADLKDREPIVDLKQFFTIKELRDGGVVYSQDSFTPTEFRSGGYTVSECAHAGLSCSEVISGGYEESEVVKCPTYDIKMLKSANIPITTIWNHKGFVKPEEWKSVYTETEVHSLFLTHSLTPRGALFTHSLAHALTHALSYGKTWTLTSCAF